MEHQPQVTPPRAIGYVRVSTDQQDTDRQVAAVQRWADAQQVELLRILREDAGASGRSAAVKAGPADALAYYADLAGERFGLIERHGYGNLLRAVASGEVDLVIFYALDRFSRDCLELLILERLLAKYDVTLVTVAEGSSIDTRTAAGKFLFRVLAAKAEVECDQTSERTASALARKQERGEKVGRPPVGWRFDAATGGFAHDPEIWPRVEIACELRAKGATYQDIASAINGKLGTKIHGSGVARLLDAAKWVPPGATAPAAASQPASQPALMEV